MSYTGHILALDLAARTGWALGRPHDRIPFAGSIQFAKDGASMAAVLSGCRAWLSKFLTTNPTIQLVIFEAPLDPSWIKGPRRFETARQLISLAGVVEELLYTRGGYDVREARVAEVRTHFLGSNRHKREKAKELTIMSCRARGWNVIDDNAADALALWDYQASLLKTLRRVVDERADADR